MTFSQGKKVLKHHYSWCHECKHTKLNYSNPSFKATTSFSSGDCILVRDERHDLLAMGIQCMVIASDWLDHMAYNGMQVVKFPNHHIWIFHCL